MDERRARIHDDLRGLVTGDLFFGPVERSAYAHDASIFEIDPLGVVVPRSRRDLVATVRYAAEQEIPLHARGAGTGQAGEALGPGLVIDFSRYLRRVLSIEPESVVVEPGAVLDRVNEQLAPLGRRIGPDPAESSTCTIGGLVSIDAAGSRSLRHGSIGDVLEGLEVIFSCGETARLGVEAWPAADRPPRDFKDIVIQKVAAQLRKHAELVARMRPKCPRNRAGYALDRVARPEGLNLARLIAGSEGTLVLLTEVRLRTSMVPAAQAAVVVGFAPWPEAARAVPACLEFGPSACELHDWRRLALARESDTDYRAWISEAAEASLVVCFEGDDAEAVQRSARGLCERFAREPAVRDEPFLTTRSAEVEKLLALPRRVNPGLLRTAGRARPVPLVEDLVVPPEALAEALGAIQAICRSMDVDWTFQGHAGLGQLNVRPFLDLAEPAAREKLEPLATQVYEAVLKLGGSISGEHACGLLRTRYLGRQYGEVVDVFREIKHAFDPAGLFNPGKIVGGTDGVWLEHLKPEVARAGSASGGLPVLSLPLRWDDVSREDQVAACGGCGDCRTRDPAMRMCPVFRGHGLEVATPRNQVNLLRQVATGQVDPRLWGSEELRANADLCVHCRLCRNECPSGIDVSSLMLEAKAAYVENHGLSLTDWMISRTDVWSRWGSRFPTMAKLIVGTPQIRWGLERFFGLSRHRVLPSSRRWSFLSRAAGLGLTRPRPHESGPRVAYFVDIFANYFDQELAESVVALLRHVGVNVYVPRGQRGCGMPSLVVGDLDRARELLLSNLRILSSAVRDGYTIVCSEPTAALMLREMSLRLTDDLDAQLVAENTMDVGAYLVGLDGRFGLPEPQEPLNAKVGYHQPCHLRALGVGTPGLDLIRTIPGLDVEHIDRGCSGMAGVYGLSRRNFRNSLRAGRGLRGRLKDSDLEIGSTECGACRMQMEQGLSKPTLHPIKLLAMAHGLNPLLRQRLKTAKARNAIS